MADGGNKSDGLLGRVVNDHQPAVTAREMMKMTLGFLAKEMHLYRIISGASGCGRFLTCQLQIKVIFLNLMASIYSEP